MIIIKHHLRGHIPCVFMSFIVSSDIFVGSSLYFSCISVSLGCISVICLVISLPAIDEGKRRSLTIKVNKIIDIHRFQLVNAKKTTSILSIGRYTISKYKTYKGFIEIIKIIKIKKLETIDHLLIYLDINENIFHHTHQYKKYNSS